MTRALVVLSGGQDSTTCLFWAKRQYDEVHAITFDYGQRHEREILAAERVAFLAGVVSHEILSLGAILKGRSPLTDQAQPLEQYTDFESMDKIIGDRVELTFVPMRNALFLTLAANRAICLGEGTEIVTGVCEADNANYPDCRQSFINSQAWAINQALGLANGPDERAIKIKTPLMFLSKAESIELSQRIGCYEALAWSHTAYDGQYPPLGNDHATVLRRHGFTEAGVVDPLVARAAMEGRLPPGGPVINIPVELANSISAARRILDDAGLGDD